MTKKQNINNNDPISKAVDLLLENTEDLTTVFKEGGLYKELTKRLVEKMLNSEMQNYLGYEKNQHNNSENFRNGISSKKLITQQGKIEIDVPRDRNSDFTPVIVAKRQRRFDGFDQQVLSLYAKGMTLSDIRMQLQELYHGADISESVISQITDDVIDDVKAWQNRPLESIYPIVYFDCIVVKVRQDKRIINKSVYIALGVDLEGKKDVLGLWISENEGAKFWLANLTEMKNRGLNDILIACSDNLTGMSEAIQSVYSKTEHQLCIVHQIRNSLKYVSYKHRKTLLIFKKTLDITFNFKLKVIFLYQRWFFVTNNELIDVLKNKKDEEFIKIIRHFKNRIKQIEKKEKLDAIDKKFKEKGIQCPNCKSYWCVKNGFKNNKQKYLCKDCKSSFDALRNHFLHWSHLSHEQWDWVIWLSLLGQSAYTISQFAKISKTSAWFNRQKFMKSPQLAKTQKSFIKLKGRIEIDETFIKEIHKGNFKNPDDPRKKWIEENAKDLNCCIEMAIDENKNIYAQTTNTKRLTKKMSTRKINI